MRNILVTLAFVIIVDSAIASSGAPSATHRIHLAQTTTPIPLTPPSLAPGTQAFTGCQINCGTQVQNCQNQCVGLASGTTTSPSVTIAGATTNSTQCALNCTTQQLICEQGCANQLAQ